MNRRSLFVSALVMSTISATATSATMCSASVTDVNFGIYDVFSTQPDDVSGDIRISCTATASYTISLSPGSGSYMLRTLTGGQFSLGYNLYVDSNYVSVWGDGTSGTLTVSSSDAGKSFPVYGRISPRQNVSVGNYADTITVTVTY